MDFVDTTQVLGNLGEFFGAIAVFATLAYLAVQIRQNTKAMRGSMLDSITEHKQFEIRWSCEIGPAYRKSIESPQDLSDEEEWEVSEWMTAAFVARENEFYQFKQGLLEEQNWISSEKVIRLILGSEWAMNWWREVSPIAYTDSFNAYVNKLIAEETVDYGSLLRRLKIE